MISLAIWLGKSKRFFKNETKQQNKTTNNPAKVYGTITNVKQSNEISYYVDSFTDSNT